MDQKSSNNFSLLSQLLNYYHQSLSETIIEKDLDLSGLSETLIFDREHNCILLRHVADFTKKELVCCLLLYLVSWLKYKGFALNATEFVQQLTKVEITYILGFSGISFNDKVI